VVEGEELAAVSVEDDGVDGKVTSDVNEEEPTDVGDGEPGNVDEEVGAAAIVSDSVELVPEKSEVPVLELENNAFEEL
jgi:hypothetical protein